MSDNSRKKFRHDRNVLAEELLDGATGQKLSVGSEEQQLDSDKASRVGGLKGGESRTRTLAVCETRAIAKKAAKARWQKTSG